MSNYTEAVEKLLEEAANILYYVKTGSDCVRGAPEAADKLIEAIETVRQNKAARDAEV